MKRISWLLTLLAISALCLVAIHHQRVSSTFTEQNLAIMRKLDVLAEENQRLSNALALANNSQSASNERLRELLRLRSEVGRLRQESNEVIDLRQQNRQLRATLAAKPLPQPGPNAAGSPGYWPKESWTFAGYGTPESALQSVLWAAAKGDLQNILESGTGDFRKQVEEDLQKKGETEMTAELTKEIGKLNSYRLLDKEIVSDNEINLTVSMDGEHAETNTLSFLRVANEWKLAKP